MNWERAVEFVRAYFESHDPMGTELSHRYPFRRRFDHCLRCSVWTRRIASAERGDVELAETAALFHDIGKAVSDQQQDHGTPGADICDRYLNSVGYEENRRAIIVGIVARHSQHARHSEATLEEKIVSDADLLDETGAVAILWDAMACALEPSPSYDKAYERSLRMTAPVKGILQVCSQGPACLLWTDHRRWLDCYASGQPRPACPESGIGFQHRDSC